MTFNPATYFRISNVTNGLALDSGGNVASGSATSSSGPGTAAATSSGRRWTLGNGYYRLVNRTNGMVADS